MDVNSLVQGFPTVNYHKLCQILFYTQNIKSIKRLPHKHTRISASSYLSNISEFWQCEPNNTLQRKRERERTWV